MIGVRIGDGSGSKASARVSEAGELIIRPAHHSDPESITLVAANGAHNFFQPVAGMQYVVTDIVLTTNKNVGTDGASVQIYEADGEDSTTEDKTLLSLQILKNDSLTLTGLNWESTEGTFINAKTDDDTVYLTIAAYLDASHDDNPATLGTGADT